LTTSQKADLHIHTFYSQDSTISPKELVFYAKKRGLTAVAVTDHNRIDGALKIAKETNFLIIPGIEVSSQNGHIVGLNLQGSIPKRLSADETVDKIHEAGGIAIACHPFALFKGSLGNNANSKFDAIETINASAFPFARSCKKAQKAADRLRKPTVAGTDAHYAPEIGFAYTIIEAEPQVESITKAIAKGKCQPFGKPVPANLRLGRTLRSLRKNFNKKRKRET
jgi:predicted metal-dependent phosphoesterase TrpH